MTEATEGPGAPTDSPAADAAAAAPATPPDATAGSEAPAGTDASAGSDASAEMEAAAEPYEPTPLTIRTLIEAGAHFGHQTRRWNPQMREFIFGDRNGTHILDLDQTLPRFEAGLDFIREVASQGGKVLMVGTKRQAAPVVMAQAVRAKQHYVNNRWLGGMLTNWKTVKKSIERYKQMLEIQADEEKRAELSKKELARVSRQCEKYHKSLEGIKEMGRLPDVMFIIDVGKEQIAVSEARRLGIPIVAIVDSNCNPRGIDFVVPANDDALRAVDLYCKCVADACIEGAQAYQDRLVNEPQEGAEAEEGAAPSTGRRVVEIKQAPRRGRRGGTASAGGWSDRPAESAPAPAPAAAPEATNKAADAIKPAPAETDEVKPEGDGTDK